MLPVLTEMPYFTVLDPRLDDQYGTAYYGFVDTIYINIYTQYREVDRYNNTVFIFDDLRCGDLACPVYVYSAMYHVYR
jgi:hypothetical protein